MKLQQFSKSLFFSAIFLLYTFISSGSAESFPFRTIAPGDQLPTLTLTSSMGQSLSTADLPATPSVLLFWGADIAEKKARSIKAMQELDRLAPFFNQHKVSLLLINAQGDDSSRFAQVQQESKSTAPLYHDSGQQAYGQLGIFIMPSVLLLDKERQVVAGMGFSKSMGPRLRGELEILLGLKSRDKVEEELNPKMVEKSASEKKARRHLQMGLVLVRKGQLEAGIRELLQAVSSQENLAEAQSVLGCAYGQLGKEQEALTALDRALELNPDDVQAEICLAQISASQGELAEAIQDLQAMLFRHGRNAQLHYVLGQLLQQQQQHEKAAQEFSKAYELLERQTTIHD